MTWIKKINKKNLHPALVNVVDQALEFLKINGTPFKVYSGLRTFEEQNKLYAKGRTEAGNIVTNARGGQSMHNYGLAVDLAPYNLLTEDPDDLWWPEPSERKGYVWYDLEEALESAARHIDKENNDGVEIEWGGRWKFRDVPHCQIRTTIHELNSGQFPYCNDVEWLVHAHTTFLFNTPWSVRRVQYMLNMQSYNAGPVDGIYGDLTKDATVRFTTDQNLDGDPRKTIERLVRLHHEAMSIPRGGLPNDLCE